MTAHGDVEDVLRLERELQTAECRSDSARVAVLLAEDFAEVGAPRRTSLWRRDPAGCRLVHHQGTLLP